MAVSATMTLNIIEYVKKSSNVKILVGLYQKSLDSPNIIYIITLIINFGFEYLKFVILLKISSIGNIEKTMIFVDSVEKSIVLEIYLKTFLPNNLKNRSNNIIK